MKKLTGEELKAAQAMQLESRKELYAMILPMCTRGLTDFQRAWMIELVNKPEFSDFVVVDGDFRATFDRSGPQRPITVLWYDTTGTLHSTRLGQLKVLRQVSA
jgi:hypothetical protein